MVIILDLRRISPGLTRMLTRDLFVVANLLVLPLVTNMCYNLVYLLLLSHHCSAKMTYSVI